MQYFLCCLALAALPVWGRSADVAPVTLFTQFQQPPSARVVESIRREVEAIMAPLGFPLEWQALDSRGAEQVAAELAVVTFRGDCTLGDLVDPDRIPGALGITHVSDGVVIPFAEIDCGSIRSFLHKDLLRTFPPGRDAAFGRAVGRVLAHELFHVFVGTTHHGSGGVAKPVFTARELMSDEFRFELGEFRLLRAGLKQARQQNGRKRIAASPLAGEFIFREDGCARCHGANARGTRSAPGLGRLGKSDGGIAGRLASEVVAMYRRVKPSRTAPPLDQDEIADVVSFLSGLE